MGSKQSEPDDFSNLPTGTLHGFVHGSRAELYSDFNHTGDVGSSQADRNARQKRTGVVLLPPLAGSEGGTAQYLTAVDVRSPEGNDLQADELLLQCVEAADRKRVAGYREIPERSGRLAQVIGDDRLEAEVPMPLGQNGTRFWLRAATLAGDPRAPGPADRSSSPGTPPEHGPSEISPGEVWVRLRHRQGGADQPEKDDHALFQIAPLVLQSNLEPARRLYVVSTIENQNFVYDVMEACWDAFGADGPFERAPGFRFSASSPQGRSTNANRVDIREPESPHPLLSPAKMYLIDGSRYSTPRAGMRYPDFWIQDQMASGYCSAPGNRAFNIVLNCKRSSALNYFVEEEMTASDDRAFVFNGISAQRAPPHDLTDFGGNIVVSPPVAAETEAAEATCAGPRVPAHPPAPHGKLILGDAYNPYRAATVSGQQKRTGTVHHETRDFLRSQEVQPIIPVNTSWLATGHVDEIMAFVPSPDGPKLAMARPDIMILLLEHTHQYSLEQGRTHFHRGRYTAHFDRIGTIIQGRVSGVQFDRSYDETSVEAFCSPSLQSPNRDIDSQFLSPIERRLRHCTGLPDKDVLPLPVYFRHSDPRTKDAPWGRALAEARTPNLVNMQVLKTGPEETHLLVPRPCGPRLPPDKAETVVRSVLNASGQEADVHLPQDRKHNQPGFPFWAWPNLKARTLALFFTREKPGPQENRVLITEENRNQMIDVIKRNRDFATLQNDLRRAVRDTENAILNANGGAAALLDNSGKFTGWHRLFIPEDTVDVLEAYTQSVLTGIGCTVHFVDAWFYHTGAGGVHCATNVLHEVPRPEATSQARPPWWEDYPTLAAADTTYDPFNTPYSASS